jgi:hypothetical protein
MPHLTVSYALTPMRAGGYRAECLVSHSPRRMCGWHFDSHVEDLALVRLQQHMFEAHGVRDVTRRKARAES